MGQLQGKVALITGAGRGQGLAAAKRFAAEGAKIVVNDLDAESVSAAVAAIRAAAGEAVEAVGDVASSADVRRTLAVAKEKFGGLDILYNNAGIGYSATKRFGVAMSDVVSCTEEDWRRILDINIGGVFLFCKYGIPMLIERGGGVIINTASIAALRGAADAHAYTATKGAVMALTRAIAVTYGPKGIRANTICPGVIDTEMIHETLIVRDDIRKMLIQSTPLRRAGTAEDIADVALFLASDASRFITGEEIVVDGGIIQRV
ncbi:MAG TPA: SDR family NAD(P)-dependent oxidoreductase [Methylomirabilota bacterium]|jgi:3-oxoacyl-[acyl-carrier protein] reductase|nr:SDR family NAD(P)-dependent oxidoreductase [Methylomirabilota bacterium]